MIIPALMSAVFQWKIRGQEISIAYSRRDGGTGTGSEHKVRLLSLFRGQSREDELFELRPEGQVNISQSGHGAWGCISARDNSISRGLPRVRDTQEMARYALRLVYIMLGVARAEVGKAEKANLDSFVGHLRNLNLHGAWTIGTSLSKGCMHQ